MRGTTRCLLRRRGGSAILRRLRFAALPLVPWVLIMPLTPWGRGLFNDGRAKVEGLFGATASPSPSVVVSQSSQPPPSHSSAAVPATVQLQPNAGKSCDVSSNQASIGKSGSGSKEEYTRITFERRFTPDALPTKGDLQTGDTLLGGQVMALAIDSRGHVNNCRIVAASGDMRPEYGCDEATAERFDASVGGLGGCPYAPGATGNVATEEVVHMLHDMGIDTGIDLDALIEAAELAEELVGKKLPSGVLRAGPRTRLTPLPA